MRTLHVVSHTHWDREWYGTFQQFRFRLVRMLDRLLDLLDGDPEYRFFTLDGQTIVLDDYLAIRPEQEPRLRRLVQEGRLLIGPWYILPDEFLEGPEAMVRNLLFGRRGCRRFTAEPEPMERIGYIPDPFGHISQLPQIAAGFGMDALCFWRGVGEAPTEFRWAAPDGTERLVLHLRDSYANGALFAMDEEGFARDLAAERDALAPHASTSHLLIMQGADHLEARAELPVWLRAAEAALGDRVLHSTLPAYLAAVQAELGDAGLASLPLRQGEMRSPERAHLLPSVLSSRMWIKQWNARCETLLTRWAEPFSALAEQVAGIYDQRGFLRQAWDWLLQNHAHDSICGCSVDQVHAEMRTRFAWSEQIAVQVAEASLERIAALIQARDVPAAADHAPRIIVFNPTAFARTDRVRARLRPAPAGEWSLLDGESQGVRHRVLSHTLLEQMDTAMDRQTLSAWLDQIAANAGLVFEDLFIHHVRTRVEGDIAHLDVTVLAYQFEGSPAQVPPDEMNAVRALLADDRIRGFHLHVVEDAGLELELLACDLPSLGYKQFVVANEPIPDPDLQRSTTQYPGPIENEFYVVEASPADSTLTITDRATGLVLPGANRFVDRGDRGDEYNFCPPENDTLVDAPATPPTIRRLDDGIGSTLEIEMVYRLPRALSPGDRSRRSGESVEVPITSRVTLTPGVRRIEFETTVDNRARDHRLRVHFPTPIVTDRSWAGSHFDVVERPVALPTGTGDWAEQPAGTHPQDTFVDVSDGQRGLMLVNRGLPEYEALPGPEATSGVTLALTLLRSVGWLSQGDLPNRQGQAGPPLPTPEAQCPGSHTFHYALAPHAGNYLTAQREALAFAAPLRAVCTDGPGGPLPPAGSFLEAGPAAVLLSAVKPPEQGDGLIVRVYNSAPVPIQAWLKVWRPLGQATLVSMDEATVIASLATDGEALTLPLRAREIATIWLRWPSAHAGA